MIILVISGISVMSYPYVSSFLNSFQQGQAVDGYLSDAANESAKEKQIWLQEAKEYNYNLLMSSAVMSSPFSMEAFLDALRDYDTILDFNDTGMMGVLEIPSINVELPIYHGTGTYALQHGVGHLETTSFPVGGTGTHAVLSAHSALPQSKLFTDLEDVVVGDTFTVTVLNNKIWYEVYDIEVVLPEAVDSLVIDPDRDLCTLITCTPYGINTHRLLVHGERIDAPEEEKIAETVSDEAEPVAKTTCILVPAIIAAAALLISLGCFCFVRKQRRRKAPEGDVLEE